MKGQDEVDKLNKRLKGFLGDRKIKLDLIQGITFTKDELYLIEMAVKDRFSEKYTSVWRPVSKRLQLDFIGWDKPEYWDVLVCRNRRR